MQQIRLASHGFVLAGYLIVLALRHPRLDPGTPPSRGLRPRWRLTQEPPPAPTAPPKLRLIQGQATASTADLYEAA